MSILDQTSSTPITKHYLENNGWKLEVNWTKWIYAMKRIDLYTYNEIYRVNYRIGYMMMEYHINSPYSKHIFVRYHKRDITGCLAHFGMDQNFIDLSFGNLDKDLNVYDINSVEDLEQTIKIMEINLNQKRITFENHQSNE